MKYDTFYKKKTMNIRLELKLESRLSILNLLISNRFFLCMKAKICKT